MSDFDPDASPLAFDNTAWELSTTMVRTLILQEQDLLLLDCRTSEEFEAGHLPGAVLLPLQEMTTRGHELLPHRDRPTVIYCRTGRRSAIVAKFLGLAGHAHVRSMAGGIEAWHADEDAPANGA